MLQERKQKKNIMEKSIQVYNSKQFGTVRTVTIDGEPWLVGKDVAEILGFKNPRQALASNVDDEDRGVHAVDTPSGVQNMAVINESGLLSLVLCSKLPSAKAFKHWVTKEVLPSIRKTGGYIAGQESMSDSELMAKALLVAQKQIEERQKRIDSLTQKVELDAPKVLFADAVAASHTSILIGEFAKLLKQNGVDIGRDRLFAWLRENGWLIKDKRRSEFNSPTQKGMNLGLFDVKEGTVINPDGSVRITRTTKITGKGQEFFINLFLRGGFANG